MTEQVEERAHAILSASGSHIWLMCTPSVRFSENEADEETEFAREGTWAHSVAAHRLQVLLGQKPDPERETDLKDYQRFYSGDSDEAINSYVRRCVKAIDDAKAVSPDALVLVEQRLDFSDWVPEGFGTGDLVIVADGLLRVRDLKFGKGVQVDAEDNTQLMLYALGAVAAYRGIYNFDEVQVEIDQPRLGHIDAFDKPMLVDDLLAWAENYVKPRASLAWKGEGEFVAGDHCRFCRGRRKCKARADHLSDIADAAFTAAPVTSLTDEQIASFVPRLDQLVKWAHDLKEYAMKVAIEKGVKWPGLKLVIGRSNRVITEPEALAAELMAAGFERALLYHPPELLGISALEKTVGKKRFAELSKDCVIKPDGKPTLVATSDPRGEWTPPGADNDFTADLLVPCSGANCA